MRCALPPATNATRTCAATSSSSPRPYLRNHGRPVVLHRHLALDLDEPDLAADGAGEYDQGKRHHRPGGYPVAWLGYEAVGNRRHSRLSLLWLPRRLVRPSADDCHVQRRHHRVRPLPLPRLAELGPLSLRAAGIRLFRLWGVLGPRDLAAGTVSDLRAGHLGFVLQWRGPRHHQLRPAGRRAAGRSFRRKFQPRLRSHDVLCHAEPVGGADRPRDATPAITRVVIILG